MKRKLSYRNEINKMGLQDMTAVEMNLFYAIVYKIKNKSTERLLLSRTEIMELSDYGKQKNTIDDFRKDMKSMGRKVIALNSILYNEETKREVMFTLFPVFEIGENEIVIEVSKHFEHWFNNLNGKYGGYTSLPLEAMINLKSSYSKELYRFIMQYKSSGVWTVSVEKFRELMCIPKSYRLDNIDQRVLNPAKEEFTRLWKTDDDYLFEKFTIKKTKTGNKVSGYEFRFKENTKLYGNKIETTKTKQTSPDDIRNKHIDAIREARAKREQVQLKKSERAKQKENKKQSNIVDDDPFDDFDNATVKLDDPFDEFNNTTVDLDYDPFDELD